MLKKLNIVILILISISFVSHAEDLSAPRAVILKYLEAARLYDTAIMSDLMHPEALKQFKDTFGNALNSSKGDLAKSEILPIFGVRTIEEFESLSNRDAFKRFNDLLISDDPEFVELMNKAQFSIITIKIEDNIAYVTYSATIEINGQTINQNVVQKLKIHDGTWRLLLAEEAEAAISSIASRYN